MIQWRRTVISLCMMAVIKTFEGNMFLSVLWQILQEGGYYD